MKKFFLSLVVLLTIGASGFIVSTLATAALSKKQAPPTTNPGSPGDNCSHGNSGKECKPDPQPTHGQDCEDHGNARGNEDHCAGTTTPTTTSTSTSTTTTVPVTTTIQTSTTVLTPTTTSSVTPVSPGATTVIETAAPLPSPKCDDGSNPPCEGVEGTPQSDAFPTSKKAKALHSKVKGQVELPYTGFPLWAIALIGALMLKFGLKIRKLAYK